MMRALYSSVAGLKSHQTKMDVIGNNISNVNTVGFKSSRVTFSTMMYQTMTNPSGANAELGTGGINAKQIGLGTNFASTAIAIETGGAAESTGNAFDLKIADTNSTSFYIVNNGSENVFTRAGAFYVDGAGNLCMESTGYTVMGWQVDANGNIQKDTVSPLKIMTAENQTSNPEWTTEAVCKGILDDNNANVNSDTGYKMNLNFFDNLGYPYVGRFAVQKGSEDGYYTVNLVDIQDQNGNSIFDDESRDLNLGDFFGSANDPQGSQVDITDNYTMASGKSGALKRLMLGNTFRLGDPTTYTSVDNPTRVFTFKAEDVNEYFDADLPEGATVEIEYTNGNNDPVVRILDRTDSSLVDTFNQADIANGGDNLEWFDSNALDQIGMISNTVTLHKVIEKMDVGRGDVLTRTQIAKINSELHLDDPLQAGQRPDALDSSKSYVVATDANGNFILKEGPIPDLAPGQTLDDVIDNVLQEGAVAGLNGDAGWPLTLTDTDFLQKGYVTKTGAELNDEGIFTTRMPGDVELQYSVMGSGSYKIVTPRADGFTIKFSTVDGSIEYIGQQGNTSQVLQLGDYDPEGNKFTNINIDFSTLKNLANGKSCTAAMGNGDLGAEGTGKKVGAMTGLTVDQSGKIYGTYDNGNWALLGQIAVARFANASGLESIGNNCFKTTLNSGDFDGIGVEIDADGSKISTGELEMSNVDLASEFTQMITTQRGYQANSRVISTSDGILEELVNLKR